LGIFNEKGNLNGNLNLNDNLNGNENEDETLILRRQNADYLLVDVRVNVSVDVKPYP